MCRILQDYLDRLEQAGNCRQLCDALKCVTSGFGLPTFAYFAIPATAHCVPQLITNYPDHWAKHYLAHRYETCDPVIQRVQRNSEPFEWSADLGGGCRFTRAFFNEAAAFGIKYGFTIPIRFWHCRFAALTFATDLRSPGFCDSVRRNLRALEVIALQFHLRAQLSQYSVRQIGDISLRPRECQCLKLASQGKSFADIALILGISPRTVKFHIENAKAKLGVHTLREAILLLHDHQPRV